MEYTALFMCFIAINIIAMMIGRIPEIVKLPKFLNFKPFNCRLCLSTHSCWVLHTLVALITDSCVYFLFGILAAVCIFKLIKHEESKRWE